MAGKTGMCRRVVRIRDGLVMFGGEVLAAVIEAPGHAELNLPITDLTVVHAEKTRSRIALLETRSGFTPEQAQDINGNSIPRSLRQTLRSFFREMRPRHYDAE